MNKLRFFLYLLICSHMPANLLAQYAGGNGRGDIQMTSEYLFMNGSSGSPSLSFYTEPASEIIGGVVFSVSVEILNGQILRDTSSSASITISLLNNPGGATLSGTTTVSAVNGLATFSDLSLDEGGSGYTLLATVSGVTSDTSSVFLIYQPYQGGNGRGDSSFTISTSYLDGSSGNATSIAFYVEPANAILANTAFAVSAEVLTGKGHRQQSATNSITLSLASNPGGGSFTGTTTLNAVNGLASFSGLKITQSAIGYTIRASAAGLTADTSISFKVYSNSLVFSTPPTNQVVANNPFTVVVHILDTNNELVTGATDSIAITLLNPGGASLSGTTQVAATAGVATFSTLNINTVGSGYALRATSTGLYSDTSDNFDTYLMFQGGNGRGDSSFTINTSYLDGSSGNATSIAFYVEPANAILVNTAFAVSAEVLTGKGHRQQSATNSITLSLASNPGGGSLTGTTTLNAVNGLASFSGLKITQSAIGYTIRASAAGLTADTSISFKVYSNSLVFSTPPTNQVVANNPFTVVVHILDTNNDLVTGATDSIAITLLNPGGASLSGTTQVVATAGVATFSTLNINTVGSGYALRATSTGLYSDTSDNFDTYLMFQGGNGRGDSSIQLTGSLLSTSWLTGGTSNFTLGSNWSSGNFPANETAVIPSGGTQPVISSGTVTIPTNTSISIQSGASLTVNAGATLVVNGSVANSGTLTFKSNATGTASLGNSSGSITGNITTERYIPAVARRYRMLSPNTASFTFSQLIDDMFITGPSGGTGFDLTAAHANNPSAYIYQETTSPGTRGWVAVNNINNSLASGLGTLVFIRGDRTLGSPAWYTAGQYPAQNAFTIDYNGAAVMGNVSPPVTYTNTGDASSDGYNLVGNPYPSAIDWNNITKTNISPFYYIMNPVTGSYVAANSGIIASGQAFLIQATATSPAITFTESCKSSSDPVNYFKSSSAPLSISLYKDSINSDIALLQFGAGFSKGFSINEDARKLTNSVVNIKLFADSQAVQINSSPALSAVADTFELSVQAAQGAYQLRFGQLNQVPPGKTLLLKDEFTQTTIPVTDQMAWPFSITSNSASAGKRYKLIFINTSALPLEWLGFKGNTMDDDVSLEWSTLSETNTNHFVVQRKKGGENTFTNIAQVAAQGNSKHHTSYTYDDKDVFSNGTEMAYYRLIEVDKDGQEHQSQTIVLHHDKLNAVNTTSVWPNPASVSAQITSNQPIHHIQITDITGKVVFETEADLVFQYEANLSNYKSGIYFIRVNNAHTTKLVIK